MTDDDATLLRRYAASGDEAAFTELVRRRFDLVYGVAVRRLDGDRDGATEVAQCVFVALSGKAASLAAHPAILGWLHTSAGFAAAKRRRDAARRSEREREAAALKDIDSCNEPMADAATLQACLDEQLDRLKPREREAVLGRFFGGKGYDELGEGMGLSANAARMSVERSLERLRLGLSRRGITSTAAAVAAALEASAASAAPAQLSGAVAAQVLTQIGAASGAASGATLLIMSKVTTALAAAGAAALIGAGLYYGHRTATLAAAAEALSRSTRRSGAPAASFHQPANAAQNKPAARAPLPRADPTDFETPWVQQEMAENPEFRGALARALAAQFRRTRGPLFRQLGLTDDQIQRWSVLNLERASEWHDVSEAARRSGAAPDDPALAAAAAGMRSQVLAKYDTALAGIIGADHVAQADQFEHDYPAQNLVDRFAAASAQTATPMAPQQAYALLRTITAQGAPRAAGSFYLNLEAVDWDKVTAQAQGFLSADQLAAFQSLRASTATGKLKDQYEAAR